MSSMADPEVVERLRILLDKFNAARDTLLTRDGRTELSFPRIVLIGNQSHGKSSVVSRVTNIKLPSRTGICTKAPLHIAARLSAADSATKARLSFPAAPPGLLKLTGHLTEANGWKLEGQEGTEKYVKQLLREEKKWPPLEEDVLAAVEEATLALAGSAADSISEVEMLLEWESSTTHTLDVIDLPGFNDLAADSMSGGTKAVIDKYIEEPNTIIMCVFGSDSADLAAFKALKEASKPGVDPKLTRTLVVFTRLDTLDKDLWKGRLLDHLKGLYDVHKYTPLGVFLVKNTDKNPDKTDASLLQQQVAEDAFLDAWDKLPSDGQEESCYFEGLKLGVPQLVKCLQQLLMLRLEAELIPLLRQLDADVQRTKGELDRIPVAVEPQQAADEVRKLAKTFLDQLTAIKNARLSQYAAGKDNVRKGSDAHLVYKHLEVLHKRWFTESITVPNYMDTAKVKTLKEIYEQHIGEEMPNDISMDTRREFYCEVFADSLEESLMKLAEAAGKEVQKSYYAVADRVFADYRKLREEFKSELRVKVLDPQMAELRKYLTHTAKAQKDVYTRSRIYEAAIVFYDNYIRGKPDGSLAEGILGVVDLIMLGTKGDGGRSHTSVKMLLDAHKKEHTEHALHDEASLMRHQWETLVYTVAVHNSLHDMVPRVVRMFLVHELVDEKLYSELIEHVGRRADKLKRLGDVDWLHTQLVDSEVQQRRKEKAGRLKSMKAAKASLESIQEMWKEAKEEMWDKAKGFGNTAVDAITRAAPIIGAVANVAGLALTAAAL